MNTLSGTYAMLSNLETSLWELGKMIAPHLNDARKDEYMERFMGVQNKVNTLRRRLNYNLVYERNGAESAGNGHLGRLTLAVNPSKAV